MEPQEVTTQILREYEKLKGRADRGEINESCIYGIIKERAIQGAAHNGFPPDYWHYYMPPALRINP